MKLTKTEKYLLNIICNLRGSAYDAWGRLNAIKTGKETVKQAVSKADLKQMVDELAGRLHADHTGGHGAHLPHPNDPNFSDELKHTLIERHRRATTAGRTVSNVYDLVTKREQARELARTERLVAKALAKQAKRA